MKIRFIYFNSPFWRAEVGRIALYIGGVKFEDVRIERDEFIKARETGSLKDGTKLPFRQMPILDVDGKSISQTGAIARYCGKIGGLYPLDAPVDAALIDQVIDMASDITTLLTPSMREIDMGRKKEMREEIVKTSLPRLLGFLEELLSESPGLWFVGDTITIADLAIWRQMGHLTSEIIDHIPSNLLKAFPRLREVCHQVGIHPKVVEWVQQTYPENYPIGNPRQLDE